MSEDECDHKFEPRNIWRTIIPEGELLSLLRNGSGTALKDASEIIRACVWHCYSHDICVHCGKMIYPKDYKVATPLSNNMLRAVKLEQ